VEPVDAKVALLPALILGAALARGATAGPAFDPERLPNRASWGPYQVIAEPVSGVEGARHRVRIVDGAGRPVREVRGHTLSLVAFEEVTGRPPAEVRIDVYSGGAHCCLTTYVFTRAPEVRNLFIFDAGNGGLIAIRDLDGDGRPEVEAANDALAYLGEIPFAVSPTVALVIGWDGRRYTDRTRHFPAVARTFAASYREELAKTLRLSGPEAELEQRANALGYYANLLVIGREGEARRYLDAHAPPALRGWVLGLAPQVRSRLARTPQRITMSQRPVLGP